MKVYVAGPLFSAAERAFVDELADAVAAVGIECFVPHRQALPTLDPATVYATDGNGLRGCDAMVAWLDGPMVDDGTACEIGIFAELVRREPDRYRGIVGLATDWRTWRRRDAGTVGGGLNLFVAGAIESCGTIVWDVEDAVATLAGWRTLA